MKTILYSFVFAFLFSCGNEKTVLLPEISHSEITEIQDVSAGYLFYNETEKDSVELNRKNLISTTNWLINVDKRLTLKQAIPHIKYLQERKENSSHKKEGTKNYFTCNDTSRKNLGFIEFTDVVYHQESSFDYLEKISNLDLLEFNIITICFTSKNQIMIFNPKFKDLYLNTNREDFSNIIRKNDTIKSKIHLNLYPNLSFNDYIDIKNKLINLNLKYIEIAKDEFISNY